MASVGHLAKESSLSGNHKSDCFVKKDRAIIKERVYVMAVIFRIPTEQTWLLSQLWLHCSITHAAPPSTNYSESGSGGRPFFVVGIGLFCYALSSSFHHVFGEWNNPWKIVAYGVFSSTACLVILFAEELQQRLILRFGPDLVLFGMSIILGYSLRYSLSDAYFLVSCAAFFVAVLILALLILHSRICYLVAVMLVSLKYSSKTQNLLLSLVLNIGLTCLYILRFIMDSYIQERYRYRVIEAMRQPLVEIVIGEPPLLEQPGATAQNNQVASVESDASAQNMEQVSLQQMENRLVAEREGQCSNVTPEQLGILSPR